MRRIVWMLSGSLLLAASCALAAAPATPLAAHWYISRVKRPRLPHTAARLDNAGIRLLKKGKYREAIGKFDAALKHAPKAARLYQNRGVAFMALGEYTPALADFNKTLALAPDMDSVAYWNRAECYQALGKPKLAVADYSHALTLKPKPEARAHMLLERGRLLVDMGKYDDASQDFNQAKDYTPLQAQAYSELAYVATMKRDFMGCIGFASQAVKADPKYVDGLVNRSTCELMNHQYAEAKDDLDAVIRLKPDMAQAYENRTAVNVFMGDCKHASEDAEKAARLNPDFADAAHELVAQCKPVAQDSPAPPATEGILTSPVTKGTLVSPLQ